jgi:hypothetical protein
MNITESTFNLVVYYLNVGAHPLLTLLSQQQLDVLNSLATLECISVNKDFSTMRRITPRTSHLKPLYHAFLPYGASKMCRICMQILFMGAVSG